LRAGSHPVKSIDFFGQICLNRRQITPNKATCFQARRRDVNFTQSQVIYRLSRVAVLAGVMLTSASIFARTLIPISPRDPRDNIQPTPPVRGGWNGSITVRETTVAVPEPTILAMVALGAGLLVGVRRFR
jgi:hypothetical protein